MYKDVPKYTNYVVLFSSNSANLLVLCEAKKAKNYALKICIAAPYIYVHFYSCLIVKLSNLRSLNRI